MTAGRRDQLVTFQRSVDIQDEAGQPIPTWGQYAMEWAAIYFGRGDERRQAAQEQGQQAATFQVLSNGSTRGVTLTDRIVHDGSNWNIAGISPDVPTRGLIEFTATRAL